MLNRIIIKNLNNKFLLPMKIKSFILMAKNYSIFFNSLKKIKCHVIKIYYFFISKGIHKSINYRILFHEWGI